MIKNCEVCLEKPSNYKCPKCYLPFCSVNCGAVHKNSDCCSSEHNRQRFSQPNPLPVDQQYTTDHTVPTEKLAQLRDDDRINELLKNPELRELLKILDRSSTPEATLKEAMKEAHFVEFVNACLNIVDPQAAPE